MGDALVRSACISHGCDICVYGHTHKDVYKEEDGIIILNPGSSRSYGTYALIDTQTRNIMIKEF